MGKPGQKKEQENIDAKMSRRMNIAAGVVGIITLGLVLVAILLNAGISLPFGQAGDDEPDWQGTWRKGYMLLGEYPQSEVTGRALTEDIVHADYDENGDAWVGETRYRRVAYEQATYHAGDGAEGHDTWEAGGEYRYFVYEPLNWRILDETEDQILLLSEQVIDCRYYHNTDEAATWQTSDLCQWLNGYFLETALGDKINIVQETPIGKVFLLDSDQLNRYLLMQPDYTTDDVRTACTPYAQCMGAYGNLTGDAWWYLRYEENEEFTLRTGSMDGVSISGIMAHGENIGTGIRPAVLVSR
ncbi:MAG: hypothetical protein K2K96_05990 [Lachnospiraceae bacterium]|nr:hypothetical protein [Lachnospiraceae bacterium]